MTEPSFTALKYQLVDRLLETGVVDESTRSLVVRELEMALGADLAIARSSVARHDVLAIVNGALTYPSGLRTLAEVISLLFGDRSDTRAVLALINSIDQRMRDGDGPVSVTGSAAPALSQRTVAMTESTSKALDLAAGLARRRTTGSNAVDATTALVGALSYAHSTSLPGVTSGLLQKLVARDRRGRDAAGLLHTLEVAAGVAPGDRPLPDRASFDGGNRETADLLALAARCAVRLSGRERISLRHLLAATAIADTPIDRGVLDELELDAIGLRQLLSEVASTEANEPAESWAAVLGLTATSAEAIPAEASASAGTPTVVVTPATVTASAAILGPTTEAGAAEPALAPDVGADDHVVKAARSPGDGDTGASAGPTFGGVGSYGFGDRRARYDLLAREAMARVITSLIRDPVTRPDEGDLPGPTVIAVEGPWGSGKSSLMGFVSKEFASPEPTDGNTRLTARKALRVISGRDRKGGSEDAPVATAGRWVATWFNPSVHQSSEQVWAGLARTILDTLDAALHPTTEDRERFWLRRNASRLDVRAIRRALWSGIWSPWFRVAVWAAALPVVARLVDPQNTLYLFGHPLMSASTLALLIPLSLLIVAACGTWWRYGRHAASLHLPADLLRGPVLSGAHAQVGTVHTETLRDPLYQARSGYLYLSQHDVKLLLEEAGNQGIRLVVFIDDLDRCGPQTTADVLSAVNLFLSEEFRYCRFVIGLDPTVVATHINQIYSGLPDLAAAAEHDDPGPGWTFLRKLVQLPVPIPHISDASMDRLLSDALGSLSHGDAPADKGTRTGADVGANDVLVSIPTRPPSAPSAEETAVLARDLEHSDRIRGLLRERLLDQPSRSVRETKRLVTVWVFYARLFAAIEPLPSVRAEERGCHLVLLAEIITRWPALQRYLSRRISGELGLALLIGNAEDDLEWARTTAKLAMDGRELAAPLRSLRSLLVDSRYKLEPVGRLAARVL